MKDGAHKVVQNLNKPEETTAWLRSIRDKKMGGRLRLYVHQFVTVPDSVFDANDFQRERLVYFTFVKGYNNGIYY